MADHPIHQEDAGSVPKEAIDRARSAISPAARAVLEAAMAQTSRNGFNAFLASMPDVGLDEDFERDHD